MLRAGLLERALYEEVAADKSARTEALIVVTLSAAAGPLGLAIGREALQATALLGQSLLLGLAGWGLWSLAIHAIGTRLAGREASFGSVLRAIGFANAPGVLGFFVFLPGIGEALALITVPWTVVAGVYATRVALNVRTGQAVAIAITGWLVTVAVLLVPLFGLWAIMGPPAPG